MTYFISGMWCGTCARSVRESVKSIDGIVSAELNYATKLLTVTTKLEDFSEALNEEIIKTVKKIGFGIKRQTEGWVLKFHNQLQEESQKRISWEKTAVVFFLAMWSTMIALTKYLGGSLTETEIYYLSVASSAFGFPAILIGAVPFGQSGLRALFFSRLLTFDFIIFVGAVSVLSFSLYFLLSGSDITYADSGAMILSFLLLSKRAELSLAENLTSHVLFDLHPKSSTVGVLRKGRWQDCEVSMVRRGETIRILANQVIPLDGTLLINGSINNHLMSGENFSLKKKAGDEVYAGAIATSSLEIKVFSPQGERLIDQWAEVALSETKPPIYGPLFSKIESHLTSFALLAAGAVSAAAYLRHGSFHSMAEAFFIGILIFCPCLFATILPLSRQISHLALKRIGIYIYRSEALLELNGIRRIVFDKTGTLEAVNSSFIDLNHETSEQLDDLLYELSLRSPHPILKGLKLNGTDQDQIRSVKESPGLGVYALLKSNQDLVVGQKKFLKSHGVELPASSSDDFPLVALNGQVVGEIVKKPIYDKMAIRMIKAILKSDSKLEVHILSGDPDPKRSMAYTSLDKRITYIGNASPEQKAVCVRDKESVYIGDGLNDVLALSAAKVGIRFGQRVLGFAPVDFHLSSAGISSVLRVFKYSRKYRNVLIQTVAIAVLYNIVALSLAMNGVFSPLGAVAAMTGSFSLMLLNIWRLNQIPEVQI